MNSNRPTEDPRSRTGRLRGAFGGSTKDGAHRQATQAAGQAENAYGEVLTEEIRIRRLRETRRHRAMVVLREQDAVITRDPVGEAVGDVPAPSDKTA